MKDDDIQRHLDALDHDGCYRLERTLKQAPHETTELVSRVGSDGSQSGPFVRKRIKRAANMGKVYQVIWENEQKGRRFEHLPHIEECYEIGDEFVVIMEFVQGQTLLDAVREHACPPPCKTHVFAGLCDAIHELHTGFDAPLIHRDLKPSNVMIGPDALVIIDFGIARIYQHDATSDTTIFGTRAFAPPEQFGYGQTDVRSDIYALGMILYFLLTNKQPSPALAGSAFDDDGIPPAMRPVLAKATAFDPAQRFQSVDELKRAFMAASEAGLAPARESEDGLVCEDAPRKIRSDGGSEVQGCSDLAACANGQGSASPKAGAQEDRRPRRVVTTILGFAWNALIGVSWVVAAIACINCIISPSASMQAYPPGLLISIYGLTFLPGLTALAYLLVYKKPLGRRWAFFAMPNLRRTRRVALIVIIAALVLFVIEAAYVATQL